MPVVCSCQRKEQDILLPLMISLVMIVLHILLKRMPEGGFPKQDQSRETLLLHRTHPALRTRLQGEWRSVGRFSVKPGEVKLTTLEEAGNSINQDTKGRLAHLAAGLTKRQSALDPAIALLTVGAMRGLAPHDAKSQPALGEIVCRIDAMLTQKNPKRGHLAHQAPDQAPSII